MYLNSDFKLIKKNKYIIWSILAFIVCCFIALFIVTSWYKNDIAISRYFNQAMRFKFFKGWTSYFVLDANILIISILVPMLFILLESLYLWLKKHKPNSFGARHFRDKKYFYYVMVVIYPIFAFLYMAFSVCFADLGFGRGFYVWSIIGWEYLIPIYVVSCLVNITIFYALLYYVNHDLSKRKDFLTSRRWERTFVVFLMTIFVYVVVLVLKSGMGRPYPMFISWDNFMDKIKAYDPSRYEHYIKAGKHMYGWWDGAKDTSFPANEQDWPWWRIAHGFFNNHSSVYSATPPEGNAFPSGHMGMTSIIVAAALYAYFSDINNKKDATYRWIILAVCILYWLNLFFSLLMDEGHWASDLSFTLICTPFEFLASYGIVWGITNAVSKHIYGQSVKVIATTVEPDLYYQRGIKHNHRFNSIFWNRKRAVD